MCSLSLLGQTEPNGSGTDVDPYQIASEANLEWMAQEVNDGTTDFDGTYFEQQNDITLTATDFTPIGGGGSGEVFKGNYDGANNVIEDLTIDKQNTVNVGLFGHIREGAVIKNLGLKNVDVTGARGTGSLVGRVTGDNTTLIEYCYANGGTVVGDGATGGLVGSNNSYKASAGDSDGFKPKISKSYANVDVTWSQNGNGDKIGGLAGCNQKGRVENSYALGDVTVDNSTTDYSTVERVGGLLGCTYLRGITTNSYAAGQVIANNVDRVGGLDGYIGNGGADDGTVTASYYDDYSGLTGTNPDLTDVTNEETEGETSTSNMKDITTFSTDWSIAKNNTLNGEIWGIDDSESINNGYPYLTQDGNDNVLPVELLSLAATQADNFITVSWATASEINNDFYEVQVSEDGYTYSTSGTIMGAGFSNVRRDYEFEFKGSNNIEYVRLRQVDFDGTDKFYGPVPVFVKKDKYVMDSPELYPNPVQSDFYISFPKPLKNSTRVRLLNNAGQCVMKINIQAGSQIAHIKIGNNMQAGMYFLEIDGNNYSTKKISIGL